MMSIFIFMDTATTEIYTLSLHDALPIFREMVTRFGLLLPHFGLEADQDMLIEGARLDEHVRIRSEEHTSELQSHVNLVCRLLLEKKKKNQLLSMYRKACTAN